MQTISITPRGAQPKVTLTTAAAAKVAELIAKEGDESLALRLGVRLVIDADSMEKVSGAVIDYRDTLQESGFHINNPNVTRSCGCGNSFS